MREHTDSAYLIHTRPYTDSRLLIDLFTESTGIVSGVYRLPKLRKNMSIPWQFSPVYARWTGRQPLKTILSLEQWRSSTSLTGVTLYCGFYINELLLKLLPKGEPHLALYRTYTVTVEKLALNHPLANEIHLRHFEISLLEEIGYGFDFNSDCNSNVIEDSEKSYYIFEPEKGFVKVANAVKDDKEVFSGATIVAIAASRFDLQHVRFAAKKICRKMINHLLGDTPLKSRELFRQF